jgi:hypothetical protein
MLEPFERRVNGTRSQLSLEPRLHRFQNRTTVRLFAQS